MIQPEDILKKADNIYREFLRAWLSGDQNFFPRLVPADRHPGDDLATAISLVRRLRESSKEVVGYGYTVEWREIQSRKLGRNFFPERIVFGTRDDLLQFTHREKAFVAFTTAVEKLRAHFPNLERWICSNIACVVDAAAELDGLIATLDYFITHPRPDCFARELPIAVDTKFIERHEGLLRQWLDIVLPPHCIRADEKHFERRFGLRYVEQDVFVRFLDVGLQREMGFSCDVLSLPLHTAASLAIENARVVVVENRVNLLTMPRLQRAICIGGLGNGAVLFRYMSWLGKLPITYWGDLDVEGFQILSRIRAALPQTESIMMDDHALLRWRGLVGKRKRAHIHSSRIFERI